MSENGRRGDEALGAIEAWRRFAGHPTPARGGWWFTLGSVALTLLGVQFATGFLLLTAYAPTPDHAWASVAWIERKIPAGALVRGLHSWAASAVVVVALLHLARVFYHGAYKRPRQANWWIGLLLLAVVFAFAFTGYLLPWDQLAMWAITVGSNMARATPFAGHEGPGAALVRLGDITLVNNASDARFALLGGRFVGEGALLRFYVLHCVGLPLVAGFLMAIHFWRIRRDGGISGPL